MILEHKGRSPKIDSSVFLAPGSCVIGDVQIGEETSIWFNVIVRGDVNHIHIGQRTNIQDGSVIHVTLDTHPTVIGDDVSVGHGVILHGCTVQDKCLVGIGAKVLDGAVIGESSLVAAGSLVTPGTKIPPRSLVMGSPAKVKRSLTKDECCDMHAISERYLRYKEEYRTEVKRID
jgi:carbonic anhydrase/acetyltransferase-like protein (isoleucine patch superfamily)